ncbi:MAG: carboxypeptidase-like regulatory domain-containing protein [Saprospiraceae bacterium]
MNITYKLSFLLLLSLLVFSSCKKDQITEEEMIISSTPEIIVDGSLSGVILDDNHQPLAGAEVRVGPDMVISDVNGVFFFRNIPLDKKGALITAEKDGYFYNSKFIRPSLNKMAFTKFKLIEKTLSGTIQAGTGGDITTNGDAKVTFPANGIKTASGAAYNGNVNVYATWMDPTGDDLLLEMPGDLRATNIQGDQVQLATYGMISVELEGDGGEPLNIADGQTASIELPVPSELAGSAPTTIPLWHFNEASGIWEEDGQATLQNGIYVGTVDHFSTWNVDVPFAPINLTGRILNESGGIEGLLVKITNSEGIVVGFGYTNEDGQFEGFVPEDEGLTITVFDSCGDVLFTEEIGSFSENTLLDAIILDNSAGNNSINVSGTLADCDQNTISNGYVIAEFAGISTILQVDENGVFNTTISTCGTNEITLIGFDLTNIRTSDPVTTDITGLQNLDAGVISVCEDLTEFFISNIGDKSWNYPLDDLGIYIFNPGGTFEFDILATTAGNPTIGLFLTGIKLYDAPTVNTPIQFDSFQGQTSNNNATDAQNGGCGPNVNGVPVPCDVTVTFTAFAWENPGDLVEATYEGEIANPLSGEVYEVSGSFRLIKD